MLLEAIQAEQQLAVCFTVGKVEGFEFQSVLIVQSATKK